MEGFETFKVLFRTEPQARQYVTMYSKFFNIDITKVYSSFVVFTKKKIYYVSMESFFRTPVVQLTPDQLEDEFNMETVLNGMRAQI